MADAHVKIDMTADGKPIAALQKLIAQRIKYTNESAKESLAACAIQILISLRAATAVAKMDKVEVEVESSLYASYFKNGNITIPCLRFKGSKARYYANTSRVIWATNGVKFWLCQVYTFVDNRGENSREYLIVAPDIETASEVAKEKIAKRIARHKTLAKHALGLLMNKTAQTSKPVNDKVNAETKRIADEMSRASTSGYSGSSSGKYSLTCEDNLDYAMLALKGGQPAFDMACAKAANKIASVLKRKVANNFFSPDIQTPFPEIRSKK